MFDTALVLFVLAGFLIVVAISQPVATWLKLPQSVVLAAIGIGIGALPAIAAQLGLPGQIDVAANLFAKLPVNSAIFIYVFLPLLVFEAGVATDVKRTIEDAAPILVLAVVATLITAAAIGFALWPFAHVPLVVCFLLGSIVATTDPAAVIAVFRDLGAPRRLSWLVEGEALLNDAAAIALFILLLGFIQAGREPSAIAGLSQFALLFAGGGVFGYVAGRLLLWCMRHVSGDRLAEGTLTLAFAYLSFIVAERLLHVSGVVAVLGAGLTFSALGPSRIAPENWSFLSELWEQIAFWARSLIFSACFCSRSESAGGRWIARYRSIKCADRCRVRCTSVCIVRAFVANGAPGPHPTHRPQLQARNHMGWASRRVDFGIGAGHHGTFVASTKDPTFCYGVSDWVRAFHAVRQWNHLAPRYSPARP
jgi:CPA1 family monovalent cation:H+ antiporter